MSKYNVTVTVDTNDGDYVTKVTVAETEDVHKLKDLFSRVKDFTPYKTKVSGLDWTHHNNFPWGEVLRDDLGEKSVQELYGYSDEDLEFLYDFLPYNEYGFHTIKSVEVSIYTEPEKIL